MKPFLALSCALLLATTVSANPPPPLPAYTERTGSAVLFHFDSVPVDVSVNSVKVCSNRSPLKSLVLWSPNLETAPTRIGKRETRCTEVTGLNFQSPGEWTLIATLENGEKARLVITL